MKNLNEANINCTGCFACGDVCPKDAISFSYDEEGFYNYLINREKCINCSKCVRVCPKVKFDFVNDKTDYCYAAYTRDKDIILNSSSGGLFSELAIKFINGGGVVIGVVWDEIVKHKLISDVEGLKSMRGSKYLQSNLSGVFNEIKELLKKEINVLFSGTPCQIAAINNFVKSDYLYTIDILCHGVPSIKSYEDSIIKRFDSNKIKVSFRDKSFSWTNFSLKYTNGKKLLMFHDGFFKKYLNNEFLKLNCYDCEFTNELRLGDITLGDFWGIEHIDRAFFDKNNDLGISLVKTNSKKGINMFDSIKDDLEYIRVDMNEDIIKLNTRLAVGKYDDKYLGFRKKYFDDLKLGSISYNDDKGFNTLKKKILLNVVKLKRKVIK